MVVDQPYVIGVGVLEAEDDALQTAHADGVEAGEITGQGMQAVARQGHIPEGAGLVQVGQGGADAAAQGGVHLAVVVVTEGARDALVGEGPDRHVPFRAAPRAGR